MAIWIVWLVTGVFFIFALTAFIVPKIVLKVYAAVLPVRVKVRDRYSDKFGEVLVYVPSAKARKYIKSYRLGKNAAGLYFLGEWNKKAAFVEYELTAYNAENSVIDIIRVKEKFNGGRYTSPVILPDKTDYVTLRLVCVDDNPVPADRRAFNLAFAFWLCALCVVLSVLIDLLLWLGITFALRCMDGFTARFTLSVKCWAGILGFTALAVTALTLIMALGKFLLREKEEEYDG